MQTNTAERQIGLAKNTSALFLLQILNYVFPLILLPYLTRILGVHIFGIYAFSFSIINITTIITDYGFNLSATYEISKYRDNRHHINEFIGAVFAIKALLLMLVVLALLTFTFCSQKYADYKLLLLLTALPIAGVTFQPLWFFQGIEKMKYITIYTGLSKLAYVVLVFMLVRNSSQLTTIMLANGFAQIGAAIYGWQLIKRHGYQPRIPERRILQRIFKESMGYFWSRAAVATYSTAGSFYLGLFAAPAQVAVFSASEQLYKAMQSLFSPLTRALYPYMARKPDYQMFFRIFAGVTLLNTAVCTLGFFLAPQVINLLYGESFAAAYPVLVIFLVVLMLTVPSTFLGYPFFCTFGKTYYANNTVILAGVIQVLLLVLLYLFDCVTTEVVALTILLVEFLVLALRVCFGFRLFRQKTAS